MTAVVDYAAGNLRSVLNALESLGEQAKLVEGPGGLAGADRLVVPGDGHFGTAMGTLESRGFADPVREWIAAGKPFMGICLGLQLLMEGSEEAPGVRGLGSFPGAVKRFSGASAAGRLKVPQIGWNRLRYPRKTELFEGIPEGSWFYFIHGYFVEPADETLSVGDAEYGIEYCAAAGRGRACAFQFHPEKSGSGGLRLIRNWLEGATA